MSKRPAANDDDWFDVEEGDGSQGRTNDACIDCFSDDEAVEDLGSAGSTDELAVLTALITKSTGPFGSLPVKIQTLETCLAAFTNDGFTTAIRPPPSFTSRANALKTASKGLRNAPLVAAGLAELAILAREMFTAGPSCLESFNKRGTDNSLIRFVAQSQVAFDMMKSKIATANLVPTLKDYQLPYKVGLQRATEVDRFKYPLCPGCKHPGLIQQVTNASIATSNHRIKDENERRLSQYENTKLGVSGKVLKSPPQPKMLVTATLQCGCFDKNCFRDAVNNNTCTFCTARTKLGQPFPLIPDPSGATGFVCSCPTCLCACRCAFDVSALLSHASLLSFALTNKLPLTTLSVVLLVSSALSQSITTQFPASP